MGSATLTLPTRRLADAIEKEWADAAEEFDMQDMPFSRLAGGASTLSSDDRAAMLVRLVEYAGTDLLCYLSDDEMLQALQLEQWGHVCAAVNQLLNSHFRQTTGIMPLQQSDADIASVRSILEPLDTFRLVAIHQLASELGSVLLAIAWMRGCIDIDQAIAFAHLDETYQAKKWGEDEEASAVRLRRAAAAKHAAIFYQLLEDA
jgi:chaperone required for assembly of F1-ATPase